jgi:hypothetical protein
MVTQASERRDYDDSRRDYDNSWRDLSRRG